MEINRRDRIVYISGPYSASNTTKRLNNVQIARSYAIKLWDLGFTVICPHLNSNGLEKACSQTKHEDFLQGDFHIIQRVDALFMIPNWPKSEGATREREYAIKNTIPIFYNFDQIKKWI